MARDVGLRTPMRRSVYALGLASAALLQLVDAPTAHACGCLSPPAVTEGDFAVNQAAEQLIFETEPGWITAHVLIKYTGDPSQFAWIVPVPEVPTLDVSPASAFGLLDQATAPNIQVSNQNACPVSAYACQYPETEGNDGGGGCGFGGASSAKLAGGVFSADAGVSSDAPGAGTQPPVTVINTQTVGDYQTVTFQASQASAAVQWLHDNGFVVNNTTSIYMETYIQQNMVFVAAKLLPGAGVTAIKPLKMRYRADYPTIPLILTAVAAQPHLTVTTFIYGQQAFKPMGHPEVTVSDARIGVDPTGRFNYPMVLARTIDESGGDGFALEYQGYSSPSNVGTSSCCTSGYDFCNIANDGQCQCPGTEIDAADCEALPDLVDGLALVQQLGQKYPVLTRLTTRLSPEQMTFDPAFEPDYAPPHSGSLFLSGTDVSLTGCEQRIVDSAKYADLVEREECTSMYCGLGECVTTPTGPGCLCNAGAVAQRFQDLDGSPSVTCVPATPPVDLRAGGDQLPDSCATASCGDGTCIDRNGVPVCQCNPGAAAVAFGTSLSPLCDVVHIETKTPGADNYSTPISQLGVCAPPPPYCGGNGKYIDVGTPVQGLDCGDATPPMDMMMSSASSSGCCQQSRHTPPLGFIATALVVLGVVLRRRRR